MINFYEIICSIDEFLNSKKKETVASQFSIDSFGNIKIIIHEIYHGFIDGNHFKICELDYENGEWVIKWENHYPKIGDYINYVVSVMNGKIKESFEYDFRNYNWNC